MLAQRLEELWYGRHPIVAALVPFGLLYALYVTLRRRAYASGLLSVSHPGVPVIVVGNLSVGGTGKTPLVIWLCNWLEEQGWRPGVVSRGYKGRARSWPQQVRPDSDPVMVGDEAVVIARRCRCPMAVAPDRRAAADALRAHHGVDVIISDDGLQHYGLDRDVEIAVVDGVRRFGNGYCLPAGPLREPLSRLDDVDLVVTNGLAGRGEFAMKYQALGFRSLKDPLREMAPGALAGQSVHCVAGIGSPERFFQTVRALGATVIPHPFPDHHAFTAADIAFRDGLPVVMTEKDAVKCERFAGSQHWCLPIEVELPDVFRHRLGTLLKRSRHGQEAARDPGLPGHQGTPDP